MQAARGTSLNADDHGRSDGAEDGTPGDSAGATSGDGAASPSGDPNGQTTEPVSSGSGAPAGPAHRHRPVARRTGLFVVVLLAVYALDVITKILAVHLLTDRGPVHVIDGVVMLRLIRNPGAAFSFLTDATMVLALIQLTVVLVILLVLARRIGSPLWAVALGLLCAGAAGNFTDRLLRAPGPLHGHVVDFIEFPYWPVFNVADTAVVTGAVLIVLQSLRGVHLNGTRSHP